MSLATNLMKAVVSQAPGMGPPVDDRGFAQISPEAQSLATAMARASGQSKWRSRRSALSGHAQGSMLARPQ
jgi:hypothetical protein